MILIGLSLRLPLVFVAPQLDLDDEASVCSFCNGYQRVQDRT